MELIVAAPEAPYGKKYLTTEQSRNIKNEMLEDLTMATVEHTFPSGAKKVDRSFTSQSLSIRMRAFWILFASVSLATRYKTWLMLVLWEPKYRSMLVKPRQPEKALARANPLTHFNVTEAK